MRTRTIKRNEHSDGVTLRQEREALNAARAAVRRTGKVAILNIGPTEYEPKRLSHWRLLETWDGPGVAQRAHYVIGPADMILP